MVCPTFFCRMSDPSEAPCLTFTPSISRMMSFSITPALSAGEPGITARSSCVSPRVMSAP